MQGAIEFPLMHLDFAGDYAPTKANFKWLDHLFLCNEASIATSGRVRDSIAGAEIKNAGDNMAITNNGDGTIKTTNAGFSPNNIVGSWAAPAGKKPLFIVMGKFASVTTQCIIGGVISGASKGYQFATASTNYPKSADGSTLVTGTQTRAGNDAFAAYVLEVNYGSATGLALHTWDGTTWTDHAPANISGQTAPSNIENTALIQDNVNPGLILIGNLSAAMPPALLKAGVQWMFARAREYDTVDGVNVFRKWIPPFWKKLA